MTQHPTLALALALTAALALVQPLPARAHSELIASEPAAGAELAAPPTLVRLSFSGALAPESSIAVLDSEFRPVTAGPTVFDPTDPLVMSVPLRALAPGDYSVQYRAVDPDDGHLVDGGFSFRALEGPAEIAATARVGSPTATELVTTEPAALPTAIGEATPAATASPGDQQAPGPPSTAPPASGPGAERPPAFYFGLVFITVTGMLAYSVLRRRRREPPPPWLDDEGAG